MINKNNIELNLSLQYSGYVAKTATPSLNEENTYIVQITPSENEEIEQYIRITFDNNGFIQKYINDSFDLLDDKDVIDISRVITKHILTTDLSNELIKYKKIELSNSKTIANLEAECDHLARCLKIVKNNLDFLRGETSFDQKWIIVSLIMNFISIFMLIGLWTYNSLV